MTDYTMYSILRDNAANGLSTTVKKLDALILHHGNPEAIANLRTLKDHWQAALAKYCGLLARSIK